MYKYWQRHNVYLNFHRIITVCKSFQYPNKSMPTINVYIVSIRTRNSTNFYITTTSTMKWTLCNFSNGFHSLSRMLCTASRCLFTVTSDTEVTSPILISVACSLGEEERVGVNGELAVPRCWKTNSNCLKVSEHYSRRWIIWRWFLNVRRKMVYCNIVLTSKI